MPASTMQIKQDRRGILNGSCFVDQLGEERAGSCLKHHVQ